MKKNALLFMIFALTFSACSLFENDSSTKKIMSADNATLTQAIADRDSLIALINDISSDMAQIKQLEQIISISNVSNEISSDKNKIREEIEAIKITLRQRQEKLNSLEEQLKSSKLKNKQLDKTIKNLKQQIETQKNEIDSLTNALTFAKQQIISLENDKDSLNQTITSITEEKEQIEDVAIKAIEDVNELNKCYYAIGTKKELKNNKILETGFLKKSKLLEGDFNANFFNTLDKRTFNKLDLHSKDAKILTKHPTGSYSIEDVNGQKVLYIKDIKSFWNLSNYLVIQVD